MNLREKLRGCFGFPVTPFKNNLSLDLAGLESNVSKMMQHAFCGCVAAGGTGEVYSLSVAEAIEVVRVTAKVVNGRVPVVGGVGFNVPMGTEMAQGMEKAGADALLVMPPYYTNSPTEGLFAYYEAIGKSTGLPLALYSRDWAVFSPDMVARLAERVPTLQIWKDGQGNVRQYQRIMSKVGDRLIWVGGLGDDCAAGYFAIGVQAYTSSISNLAPRLSLAISDAGLDKDFNSLNHILNEYVHPIYAFRERTKGYEVSAMKVAMDVLGLKGGPVRPPLQDCTAEERVQIAKLMEPYQNWL